MYYPVSLKVKGERCLVVGGGPVALRKARALLRAGARVRAVAPELVPGLRAIGARRRFRQSDLKNIALVISAADDPAVNLAVSRACRKRGIPVNVVDQPDLCTFIVPSVVRRGPLTIAISTAGLSPALSKGIRKEIERLYPARFAALVRRLGAERRRLMRLLPPSRERTRLLKGLVTAGGLRKARAR